MDKFTNIEMSYDKFSSLLWFWLLYCVFAYVVATIPAVLLKTIVKDHPITKAIFGLLVGMWAFILVDMNLESVEFSGTALVWFLVIHGFMQLIYLPKKIRNYRLKQVARVA